MMAKKKSKKKISKKKTTKKKTAASNGGRKYLSQSVVPIFSIDDAIRVAQALVDHYGDGPASPLQVASALNMSPNSSHFRTICGSSIAYGFTDGGWNAEQISLSDIGKRATRPLEEGADVLAKREALLRPTVVGQFLNKYNNSPIPRQDIAVNVLSEMSVPRDRCDSVFQLICDGAKSLGLVREIKGKEYVDLSGANVPAAAQSVSNDNSGETVGDIDGLPIDFQEDETVVEKSKPLSPVNAGEQSLRPTRVFITHGKNKAFIEPIKKLLGFGQMTPVVSVEKQSVSKPVPDKVMDDMRSCGAAIIHVDGELSLIDQEANSHSIINPNVLIEIGAAMALYGRRYILLVKKGTTLPSNLQGLYEVRYEGDALDGNVTMQLLEAINELKKESLPQTTGGR